MKVKPIIHLSDNPYSLQDMEEVVFLQHDTIMMEFSKAKNRSLGPNLHRKGLVFQSFDKYL